MKGSGSIFFRGLFTAMAVAVTTGQAAQELSAQAQAPLFEVDPFFPRPLDYPFILGSIHGLTIDQSDNIYLVHGGLSTLIGRTEAGSGTPTKTSDCCTPTREINVFDSQGRLVRQFGGTGTGYAWPDSVMGIGVDPQGNVWVGGVGANASHIVRFASDGRFLSQIGQPSQASDPTSRTGLSKPSAFAFDGTAGEAYVADSGNRRVAVLDINTGAIKRFWGAFGNAPTAAAPAAYSPTAPPSQQFGTLSCIERGPDGMIYVCDRSNNRIQVFRPDGTFVREKILAPRTTTYGSVWDLAFSPDRRFVYVADGANQKVRVLDATSLNELTFFGMGGRYPGQFYGVGSVVVDSRGNVFTGEAFHGKRLQRFNLRGMGPANPQGQTNTRPTR